MKKNFFVKTLLALTIAVGLCANTFAAYAPGVANEEPAEIVGGEVNGGSAAEEAAAEFPDLSAYLEETVGCDGNVYQSVKDGVEVYYVILPEYEDMFVLYTDRTGREWLDVQKGYKVDYAGIPSVISGENAITTWLKVVENPDFDYAATDWYWPVGEAGHEDAIASYAADVLELAAVDAYIAAYGEGVSQNSDEAIAAYVGVYEAAGVEIDGGILFVNQGACSQCESTTVPRYGASVRMVYGAHSEAQYDRWQGLVYSWYCTIYRQAKTFNLFCHKGHFVDGPLYEFYGPEEHSLTLPH